MPEQKGANASSWLSNRSISCDKGFQDSSISAYDLDSQVGEHPHADNPFDLLSASHFYEGCSTANMLCP